MYTYSQISAYTSKQLQNQTMNINCSVIYALILFILFFNEIVFNDVFFPEIFNRGLYLIFNFKLNTTKKCTLKSLRTAV